ncbi:MAG: hypothetical protein K2X82_31540 [Gemmataceae bacterium]|nr:hypothetical protein [Gemmataceae bacterium]
MKPVLKRIAVHGLGAAAVLGLIGAGLGELAALSLTATTPTRAMPVESAAVEAAEANPVGDSLRTRVPVMLALWGFLFVAGGELLLARRRKPAPPPEPAKPDSGEVLLLQLLREAEAKSRPAGDNTPSVASGG